MTKRVILNWCGPEEVQKENGGYISIIGDNQFVVLEAWDTIKAKVLEMLYEGEFVKIIHNILKNDADTNECIDSWEIEISVIYFSSWGLEEIANYQNEILMNLIVLLNKAGFELEIDGPHSSRILENEIIDFVRKESEDGINQK